MPRSPQGYPVLIQAGDSDGGRELAAKYADVIFSRHSAFDDGQAFYADVKRRLARYGRASDDLKIIPAATVGARRHRGRRPRAGGHDPAPAGEPARRHRLPRAGVGPRPLGLRPRRSAARRRPRRRRRHLDHPRPGAPRRATRSRWPPTWRALAEREEPEHPPARHRGERARSAFVGTPSHGRRADQRVRAGRRGRRLHLRSPPHAARPRRLRRQGRARAAGARRVPRRLHGPTLRDHLGLGQPRASLDQPEAVAR